MQMKKSILNITSGLLSQFIIVILGFVSKKYFIKMLGDDINGLNGALNTLILFLSLLELGIGSTLIIQLYQPVAKKQIEKICGLLCFFKKIYHWITYGTIGVSLFLIPFLPLLIKGNTSVTPFLFYTTYGLFVIGLLINYPYSAERALLQANQNIYILTTYDSLYSISRLVVQLIFLFLTKNYLVFLMIDIVLHLFENELLKRKIHKNYPYLQKQNKYQLSETEKATIESSSKSLGIHKLANFLLTNSDNFFLAAFFSLQQVGLFNNYFLIITTIGILFSQFAGNLTAGFGNLLLESNLERSYHFYRMSGFINFLLTNFSSICLWILLSPFVQIWLGASYIIPSEIVLLLVINFTISSLGAMNNTLRSAAGNFKEDRYLQLSISLFKLFLSFIGLYFWGIHGLLLSTTISLVIREVVIIPRLLYRKILKIALKDFYREYLVYGLTIFFNGLMMTWLSNQLHVLDLTTYPRFLLLFLTSLLFPTIVTITFYHRTKKFQDVKAVIGRSFHSVILSIKKSDTD